MYSTPMIYIYLRTLNKFEMNYYGNMLIVDKKMLSCVVFFTKRVTLLCLSSANNQHLPPLSLSLSLKPMLNFFMFSEVCLEMRSVTQWWQSWKQFCNFYNGEFFQEARFSKYNSLEDFLSFCSLL